MAFATRSRWVGLGGTEEGTSRGLSNLEYCGTVLSPRAGLAETRACFRFCFLGWFFPSEDRSAAHPLITSSLDVSIVSECSFLSPRPRQDQVPYIFFHKHEPGIICPTFVKPCLGCGQSSHFLFLEKPKAPSFPGSCLAEPLLKT